MAAHLPERHAAAEPTHHLGLDGGEVEQLGGRSQLAGWLGVDDARLRVEQQALGQLASTAMLATPQARESFQEAWSQRATPRSRKIAHASSTTSRTCRPLAALAVTTLWSQAVAQTMSAPSAGEP